LLYPLQYLMRQMQFAELMRARGLQREIVHRFDSFLDRYGYLGPFVRAGVAVGLFESGKERDARAHYEALWQRNAPTTPRDANYLPLLCRTAQLASYLGDRRRADALYEKLVLYEGYNAVMTVCVSVGSVDRYLGLCAELQGDRVRAGAHLEAAARVNERMRAGPELARTRLDLARVLSRDRSLESKRRALEELDAAQLLVQRLGMTGLASAVKTLSTGLR
jgi:tetratricopeptide (TPR) repeat protein